MNAGPKRNLKLRYSLLAAAVGLAIAGWSAGWFYLRGELDQRIDLALGGARQTVTCPQRQIAGFPFRFEVTCRNPVATAPAGAALTLARVQAVALAYNPWHIIFEAFGPVEARDPLTGSALTAHWSSARSSLKLATTGVRQIDVVLQDVDLETVNTAFAGMTAKTMAVHARPVPETSNAAEAFLSFSALEIVPANAKTGPLDGKLHLRLDNGMDLLAGRPLEALPRAGDGTAPIELVHLSLASARTELSASGQLRLAPGGGLSGKVSLLVRDVANAEKLLAQLFPSGSPAPKSLAGAAVALGSPKSDDEGRQVIELPLTLKDGAVWVGLVPLGLTIPPLAMGL